MQKQLTNNQNVLNEKGILTETGYAMSCIKDFDRTLAKPQIRIKEWDFYQISNDKYVLQFTIGHVSYAGGINATLYSLDGKERFEFPMPLIFPMGSLNMPKNGDVPSVVKYEKDGYLLRYEVLSDKRTITFRKKSKKWDVEAEFVLGGIPGENSILVATPFEKKNHFYFNYKVCCMETDGFFKINGKEYTFRKENTFGLLDWGRGILPYTHKWWWGSGSTRLADGKLFGFNIGVFGNTENATENVVFHDGSPTKINNISIEKGDDYMSKWKFSSDDGKFNLTMTPIYDNYTEMNFLIAHNRCHQVFGKFNGTVFLDDGKVLEITDMVAFCEMAHNRW